MTLMIPQSTAFTCVFKAFLSSDHVSEATAKTIAITISKNGATSFSNPNAGATNATEMASGWYKVALDTTDTGTTGPLAVRGTASGIDDVGVLLQVVKATNGGWTAIPDTAVTTNGSLITAGTSSAQLTTSSGQVTVGTNNDKTGYSLSQAFPTNFSSMAIDASGRVDLSKILGGAIPTPNVTGVPIVDLKYVLGTAITETATGRDAASLTKLLDVATPVLTAASVNQTGDSYARLGAPAGASVSADVAAVKSDSGSIKTQTDKLTFTVANQIDANVLDWKSSAAPAMTGDAYARLGAPAGASVSADIASVQTDTTAIKGKTTSLTFTVSGKLDANVLAVNGVTVNGAGTSLSPWGP